MDFLKAVGERGSALLGDGAWGTFLYSGGLKPGMCPELWNIENPEFVQKIASAYADSGSDCVETNSFGGSSLKLADYGLQGRARELNVRAAELSRAGAGADRFVLGSIGPTGKLLMMGDVTEEQMFESFREQAAALSDGGADALCIETMSDLREAQLALQAARDVSDLPLICTFTFDRTPKAEFRTMMGLTPEEALNMCISEGVAVAGSNCGNGIEDMLALAEEMRGLQPDFPLMFQANAGLPRTVDGKLLYDEGPEMMAAHIPGFLELKTAVIGGCCGTGPEHIRAFRRVLDNSYRV